MNATIETERLVLRPFTESDGEAMFNNWASDPEVTRYLRWDPHTSVEQSAEFCKACAKNADRPGVFQFAITLKSAGELIGSIGAGDTGDEHWETGYCVARSHWNKGIMTEAHNAVVDFLFDGGYADKLYCCHSQQNPASGRVMQKAGFVCVGEGSYKRFDGTVIPAFMYELTKAGRETVRNSQR